MDDARSNLETWIAGEKRDLEALESGDFRLHKRDLHDEKDVDVTEARKAWLRAKIAEYEDVVRRIDRGEWP